MFKIIAKLKNPYHWKELVNVDWSQLFIAEPAYKIPSGFDLEEVQQKQTNSVALSPRANYTDWLSDYHLSTKFSVNFCG
jgi:hypothetical protein